MGLNSDCYIFVWVLGVMRQKRGTLSGRTEDLLPGVLILPEFNVIALHCLL